jgi:hypothetical protein
VNKKPEFHRILAYGVILLLLVSLSSFFALATQTRPLQDDYCYGELVHNEGFFRAQYSAYFGSTACPGNRYATTMFSGIWEILFKNWYPIAAFFSIFAMIAGCVFLVKQITQQSALSFSHADVLIVAGGICFLSLYMAPNRFQTLFFRSSSITYFYPAVFNVWISNIYMRYLKTGKPINLYALAITALVGSGFSEVGVVIQLCMWALIYIFSMATGKGKRTNRAAMVITMFSFAGLLGMLLCPNNAERQANFGDANTIGALITDGPLLGVDFIFYAVRGNVIPIVAALMVGVYAGVKSKNPFRKTSDMVTFMAGMVLIGYGLIVIGILPSLYVYSAYPDGRGFTEAVFFLTTVMCMFGLCIGWTAWERLPKVHNILKWAAVFLLVGMGAYFAHAGLRVYADYPTFRARAVLWDERDAHIRNQILMGKMELSVPALDSVSETAELQANPGHWVNLCAARYYGADSIRALE